MPDTAHDRLKGCFRIVFPDLPEESITSASQESVPVWDSIATITLVTMVDEEFGVALNVDNLGELDSFQSILTYVKDQGKLA